MRAWWIFAGALLATPTLAAVDLSEEAFHRTDEKLCMGNWCVNQQRLAYESLVRAHAQAKGKWRQTLEDVVESQTRDGVTDWLMVNRMRPDVPESTPHITKTEAGMCWMDYCPCDETGDIDRSLCRDIRGGLKMSPEIMSSGAHLRDARKNLERYEREHPNR